jgi:hypothetical protein
MRDIKISLSDSSIDTLCKFGAPNSLKRVTPFTFRGQSFTVETPKIKPYTITSQQQHDWLKDVLETPNDPAYLLMISGEPDDSQALLLAAYIMWSGLSQRKQPKWINVYAGFNGPTLSKSTDPLSTIVRSGIHVFSNVLPNSTPHKLEKLRDYLVMTDDCPRIVVTSGGHPMQLCTDHLMMQPSACLYVASKRVKVEVI